MAKTNDVVEDGCENAGSVEVVMMRILLMVMTIMTISSLSYPTHLATPCFKPGKVQKRKPYFFLPQELFAILPEAVTPLQV